MDMNAYAAMGQMGAMYGAYGGYGMNANPALAGGAVDIQSQYGRGAAGMYGAQMAMMGAGATGLQGAGMMGYG